LMRGEFTPGRPLTIRALANALHTSSMPVREALRQLVTERALEMLPNRSFGVPRLSSERYRDLLRVRVELEGFAAAEAATQITSDDLQRLRDTNEAMRAASDVGDRLKFVSCNKEFHFTIYRASGSNTLIPLIETLWLQAGPYMGCLYNDGLDPVVNLGHHEGLIKALRRKDPEKSRAMLVADITTPAERIIELANARFAEKSTHGVVKGKRAAGRRSAEISRSLSNLRDI
jgi:DNA-binding GntR family transcriptional regulator